jgi:hypothetical protein
MYPLLRHRPSLWIAYKDNGAGWWVLSTANAAGTNSLTYLPKHGGARDNKFYTYTDKIHTYIPLTPYPQRGSRGISDIPTRHPRFTKVS